MTVQLDEFKTRQRSVWGAGDYGALSPYIADVGALVVARAGIEPGTSVLDVACGTGSWTDSPTTSSTAFRRS
jgi:2-polyprenyl-3-methyl-5-hydroxy-6-metoxy-1,4-benzoquinol methylase